MHSHAARAHATRAPHVGPAAGATQWGYVLQGGCKFGFFEVFKKTASTLINNPETTSKFKMPIYMISSALAETIATVALCPFEAVRIKQVTQPSFARGMFSGMAKIRSVEGTFGYDRAASAAARSPHTFTRTHAHPPTHTHTRSRWPLPCYLTRPTGCSRGWCPF